MGNPFVYPKAKHSRRETPPTFPRYNKYKPFLQREFNGQCVYCRSLDNKGYETFGVDHYRPKKLFPLLETEYLNLFYACNRCNNLKRDYWPSADQNKLGRFIPNPCEHVMFDHMRYQKGTVVEISLAGEFTIERLDINDPSAINFREGVIAAILLAESQILSAEKYTARIEKHLRTASGKEKENLESKLDQMLTNISELKITISQLGG